MPMTTNASVTAGLDIGTTKICCVIARQTDTGAEIIGVGMAPSPGVRQGQILNIGETARAIRKAVESAQQMAGVIVGRVVIGIADRTVKSSNCTGMISLSREEITPQHIQRVLASARSSLTATDCELLHIIPREYRLDGLEGIANPLGMTGSRLEVRAHLVTAATVSIRNLSKACERAGLDVCSVVLQSLASADAVLTPDETEMGVALIDIGGGTTDISVFKHGVLWYTAELMTAGSHITADLARHFRILPAEAERLKLEYGGCMPVRGEIITSTSRSIQREDFVNVITARIEELITEVATHTRRSRHGGRLVAGLVITGGTALLPDLDLFLEQLTNVPVRIGTPRGYEGLADLVANPACSTGVGLVLRPEEADILRSVDETPEKAGTVSRVWSWLKARI